MLQSMGSQRVRHNLVTEQQQQHISSRISQDQKVDSFHLCCAINDAMSVANNYRCISNLLVAYRASLVAQLVKNPPAMEETWV